MASIAVRYFAGAAEAAGRSEESVDATSTAELRATLAERHGADFAEVLARCSLLVDGVHEDAAGPLCEASRVDVLPPFAGG